MGWRALITYLLETDDRAERYFLEVKSGVNLSTKKDQAKIAKFILGAANRDQDLAFRRFGGHALMFLGVGNGQVVGVPSFEAKDLAVTVGRLIGADGPRWDFERIRVDDQDVIVIVADPPTGEVWTCRADGDGLTDGAIFVRADGETRRATGDEIRGLIDRAKRQQHAVDVSVAVAGEVVALHVDLSALTGWIQQEAERLRDVGDMQTRNNFYGFAWPSLGTGDTRSREEYLLEVDRWEKAAKANPTAGVVELAGRMESDGIRLQLANRTKTFLRDVRVDLVTDDDTIATEWIHSDADDPIRIFHAPKEWGKKSFSHLSDFGSYSSAAISSPANAHGVVFIKNPKPASLTMHMEALRPEETHVTDADEVVLVMLTDVPPDSVTLRWQVTAQDVNDIFEGTCEVPVRARDWRAAIHQLLYGQESTEEQEA